MKPKVLRPVLPDAGLEVEYRKKMRAWMQIMHTSVMHWIMAAYRRNEPEMAQDGTNDRYFSYGDGDRHVHQRLLAMDAIPAKELQKAVRKLVKRWRINFNEAAPLLAKWFATKAYKRSTKRLQKILKDAGISVQFKMTKAQRDVFHATVNQNVSLIKSIPTQYLAQVEGLVMRSVQVGGDLETLTNQLEKHFGVTKKRAALIARDQNLKATGALNRARQLELGIDEAIWVHSHAGKTPRPAHLKMDGKKYNLKKGMWDSHEKAWIQTGQLINCRCFNRPVIKGFSI